MRNYHNVTARRILSTIIAIIMCMTAVSLHAQDVSAAETANAAEGIRYDYDIFVINKYDKLYTQCNVLLYVKTDNPDPSTIHLDYYMRNMQKISDATSSSHLEYDDVEVLNPGKAKSMAKVEGGYLYKAKIASEGKLTVTVWENGYNTDESVSVMLYDHKTAYMEWAEEMFEKHTNDSMTGPQKMGAMCEFIEENFTYFPQLNVGTVSTDGVECERQLYFTFNEGSPYMDTKVGHCWHFADLMVTFGKIAGYDGYRQNADYLMHQYAVIIIDGEEHWYDPYVPVESGNYTDEDLAAVPKVDFSQYVDDSDHVEIGSTYQKESRNISMLDENIVVNIDEDKFSYDNGELKGVTLTYYDRVLEENLDYIVKLHVSETYYGTSIGMDFRGINDFRDILYKHITEPGDPIDISTASAYLESGVFMDYDGTEKKPKVRVVMKNPEGSLQKYSILYEGHHYTLSYEDNINPGTAKVIIEGMGYYTGTIVKTFTIEKKETSAGTSTGKTAGKDKGAPAGKGDDAGAIANSDPAGDTTDAHALKKVNKPKVKKAGKTKIKVSWNNIKGESGYEIYRSAKKNKGFKLAKRVKSSKAKSTTLKAKKNKKYYYKVRAYKTIKSDGKTYKVYGPWSAVKSYKLK